MWGLWLLALRLIPTITMAWLSYRFIERPIRTGVALPGRLGPIALAGGLAAVLLVAVPVGRSGDEQQLVFRELDPKSTTTVTTTTPLAPDVSATAPAGATSGATVPAARRTTTTTLPPVRAPRVVVVGDSTAAAIGGWARRVGRRDRTAPGRHRQPSRLRRAARGAVHDPGGLPVPTEPLRDAVP
ncbi:MAG: hypothetical protein Q8K58_16710 [Acidimicrobiales bacterium]|nr:hypothetical protein [Acidimicrobiales bacterium]